MHSFGSRLLREGRSLVSTQTFDPVQYKAAQRTDWSDAATGWREWWKTIEASTGAVNDRLVDLAEIKQGERVLDVATGIGEPAATAARRVGPDGRVVATDIAPGMLEIGRERAAELGLDNIDFREADAEELRLPDVEFDAVLCRFGLMFLPDLGAALERIRDALAAGGRFAAATWGEQTPFLAVPLQTVAKELEVPPPAPGTPGPLSLTDSDALEGRLREAGFTDVRSERMMIDHEFASADEFVRFLRAIAAPIKKLLADKPKERQEEVWDAIARATEPYASPDGAVRLGGEVILVSGRR
jgi:SAM-dependent methyltransferase